MQWFNRSQGDVDTIVFVHGILGHHIRTWGQFPRLLSEDEDLPEVDILLWGFRTGFFSKHHELHLEGGHLVTTLETLIQPQNDIALVGHSLGGLLLLKGLVDRMSARCAQKPPCSSVSWITLFASPLSGVWLAGLARSWLALPLRLMGSLHKHLRALIKGDGQFADDLLTQVRWRMCEPVEENEYNRRIPIRIVAATRDRAVDKENRDFALAPFKTPAPYQLDETHRSVKLPRNRDEVRYRALASDLQRVFTRSFRQLSLAALDQRASEQDRIRALNEMLRRYGKIIRSRVCSRVRPLELRQEAEKKLLLLLAEYGGNRELPVHILANEAIDVLAHNHPSWR